MWTNRYGSYDDLARIKEWSAAGGLGLRGMVKAPRPIPDAVRATQARASDPGVVGLRLGQCRFGQDPCAGAAGDPAAARQRAAGEDPLHHLHQGRRRQHGGTGVLHARPLGHARRCGARRRDPRGRASRAQCQTAAARPRIVRRRAGNAGRAEGADHPRALHPAAAAISVRGQRAGALCGARRARPDRNDGARQSRRCCSRPSRDPDSATGRALNIAMASAADVTFKDVVREACLSRDHFMAWTDAAGSADAAAAQMSAALGVDAGDASKTSSARSRRAASAAIAVAGDRRHPRHRQQDRTGARRPGFATRWRSALPRRSTNISACS